MNLKRIMSFLLVVCIFITLIPVNAFAATYMETNRDNVPVWDDYTKYSTKVRTISSEGTIISVGKKKTNIFGNVWYKVSGGYIYSGNLRKHTNHVASACAVDYEDYEQIDSKNHYLVKHSGDEVCVCGKVVIEGKSTKTKQAHSMSKGKCTKCGYKEHVHKESKTINAGSSYEDIDSDSHTLVKYSGDKVCSCGEVVKKGSYTRTEQNHMFVGNKCQKCNYEKTLHVHREDERRNKSSETKSVDATQHVTIKYSGDAYCRCGELLSTGEKDEKYGKHDFSRDVCTVCGYKRDHVHERDSSKDKNGYTSYEDKKEDTHTKVVKAVDKYCWCGDKISTGKITETVENHLFVGNKCSRCGYEKTLHVHREDERRNKSSETKSVDESRHVTIKYSGDAYCRCGELLSYGNRDEKYENHEFYRDVCTVCGYKREHVHVHDSSKDGKKTTTYEDKKPDTHTKVVRSPDKYCWCGDKISTGKTTETVENHLFVGNKCSACGYEKNIHVHNKNDVINIPTEYKVYDEEYHNKITHSGKIQCSCGELMEADTTSTTKEKHSFDNNVCKLCNHKKTVHVHVVSYTKNAKTSFGENEDWYHNIIEYSGDEYCNCDKYMGEGTYNYKKEPHDFDENDKCTICGFILVKSETDKILEQVILGDYSDEVTFTGTAGQVLLGEIPVVSVIVDFRDLVESIENYESPADVGLNLLAFLPFGSSLKYSDELVSIVKNSDEVIYTIKKVNETSEDLIYTVKKLDKTSDKVRVYKKVGDEVTQIITVTSENADDAAKIIDGLKLNSGYSSKILRDNMEKVGIEIPDYHNAAHHIVAGNKSASKEAKDILDYYGININHPSNGVFLPDTKGDYGAVYHPSMHTNEYYQKLTNLLQEAHSKEEVLDVLEYVAEQLKNNTF